MIIYVIIFIILGGICLYVITSSNGDTAKTGFSVYQKKKFLFDTPSEFHMYKMLLELFGDKYFIFPQVNYSHLIEPKKSTFIEERKYRSRIDRKSADFVFCDKETMVPVLVIELDGYVHDFKDKRARDEFINEITQVVDLPMLHIKTVDVSKEFVKKEIEGKLGVV